MVKGFAIVHEFFLKCTSTPWCSLFVREGRNRRTVQRSLEKEAKKTEKKIEEFYLKIKKM
jgi:hypothetical protein